MKKSIIAVSVLALAILVGYTSTTIALSGTSSFSAAVNKALPKASPRKETGGIVNSKPPCKDALPPLFRSNFERLMKTRQGFLDQQDAEVGPKTKEMQDYIDSERNLQKQLQDILDKDKKAREICQSNNQSSR